MTNKHKNLDMYSAVEIYEMILSNELKRFPPYFWKNELSLYYAEEIGKYVIEKHFGNDNKRIIDEYGNSFINRIHLHSVLKLFNGKAFEYIDFIYPNRFKPWQFKSCPNHYWNNETAIGATKWLIEEHLKWNTEDVRQKLTYKIFEDNKLNGMLSVIFDDSIFKALNEAYPNTYLPWELSCVPKNFWKSEKNVEEALKWFIEKKLQVSTYELEKKLTIELLTQNGFSGMLRWYHGIPYNILEKLYPNVNWEKAKQYKMRYQKNNYISNDSVHY